MYIFIHRYNTCDGAARNDTLIEYRVHGSFQADETKDLMGGARRNEKGINIVSEQVRKIICIERKER